MELRNSWVRTEHSVRQAQGVLLRQKSLGPLTTVYPAGAATLLGRGGKVVSQARRM